MGNNWCGCGCGCHTPGPACHTDLLLKVLISCNHHPAVSVGPLPLLLILQHIHGTAWHMAHPGTAQPHTAQVEYITDAPSILQLLTHHQLLRTVPRQVCLISSVVRCLLLPADISCCTPGEWRAWIIGHRVSPTHARG